MVYMATTCMSNTLISWSKVFPPYFFCLGYYVSLPYYAKLVDWYHQQILQVANKATTNIITVLSGAMLGLLCKYGLSFQGHS